MKCKRWKRSRSTFTYSLSPPRCYIIKLCDDSIETNQLRRICPDPRFWLIHQCRPTKGERIANTTTTAHRWEKNFFTIFCVFCCRDNKCRDASRNQLQDLTTSSIICFSDVAWRFRWIYSANGAIINGPRSRQHFLPFLFIPPLKKLRNVLNAKQSRRRSDFLLSTIIICLPLLYHSLAIGFFSPFIKYFDAEINK